MREYLKFIFLLTLWGFSGSIKIERDFKKEPTEDNFDVYWNVPTFLCQKHGVNFTNDVMKYGIKINPEDEFRGREIILLYDPGLFPSVVKKEGKKITVNHAIPQLGNLTAHLEEFKAVIEKVVPKGFSGLGIIDFEIWRPVFRQNWNAQTLYRNMSLDLERQQHVQWTEEQIKAKAAQNFETAARAFMESTLQLVKLLRPAASWGYYGFPYCYNYRKGDLPTCADFIDKENRQIHWLFDESTALYPSVYMSAKYGLEDHKKFVIGRLNEAWRVASRVPAQKFPRVNPYVWYNYYDKGFMSYEDMYQVLDIISEYRMGGAIIWGATADIKNKTMCQDVLDYLNTKLGPAVQKVRSKVLAARGLGSA